ncbi:MAG: DUF4160 domain-containing protein [Bacteroidetes bacterium]|nr:DUF4160 domain-containing protein [Bacteroidota bacterium]
MPVISMFYGIIIMMYFKDRKKHKLPHIHVKYQENEAVINLKDSKVLEGKIPSNKKKLLEAWIELHRDELLANWELAVNGQQVFQIEPLR